MDWKIYRALVNALSDGGAGVGWADRIWGLTFLSLDECTLQTCWESGGKTKCVTTERKPGETLEEFASRHFAAVVAKMMECPPD
ncbi:MAG: hypothetical protein B7733_06290 [Myxococcales bacterium FL481]|nr:MAG: hypothetical protein B7733_06290 [Myxococcales bacterium FL481]